MKHTPGPWEVCIFAEDELRFPHVHLGENTCTNPRFFVSASGERHQCCGDYITINTHDDEKSPRHSEVFDSNARLIAAAPELLEALKAMVQIASAEGWKSAFTGRQIVLEESEKAIAKAEGQ